MHQMGFEPTTLREIKGIESRDLLTFSPALIRFSPAAPKRVYHVIEFARDGEKNFCGFR